MEEKKLDDLLRERLESLEAPVPDDAWSKFAGKWDIAPLSQPPEDKEAFDREVAHKLEPLHISLGEKTAWANFCAHFARVRREEHKILWFKSLEVSLVAVLFLTFLQKDRIIPQYTSLSHQLFAAARPQQIPLSKSIVQDQNAGEQVSSDLNALLAQDMGEKGHANLSSEIPQPPQRQLTQMHLESLPSVLPRPLEIPMTIPHQVSFSQIQPIPSLTTTGLPGKPHQVVIRNMLDLSKWRITFLTGIDGDQIDTDGNIRYRVPPMRRYAGGFHLGFLLSEGTGRLETGFGMLYARKDYDAPNVTFVMGSLREGYTTERLKRIALNLLQIPIFTRLRLVQNDKWRVYATAGGTAHLTLTADYSIVHPGFYRPSPGKTTTAASFDQNLEEGLLQGGLLADNAFLTLDAGLGVERTLTPQSSLFLQPGYRYFFGHLSRGVGPYNDRISSLTLQTGMRINLFKPE